jgi:catechol 2,3-dioxygenase-like lactoylglutathione lyase family enzyme
MRAMAVARPEDQLVLELFVRDFGSALAFYTALGFEVERSEPDFAVLRWEGCGLLLALAAHRGEPPSLPAGNLRVMVPDVDAVWRRVLDLGARVHVRIADRDYGLRDFIVLDPDGFGVRFASPIAPPSPPSRL